MAEDFTKFIRFGNTDDGGKAFGDDGNNVAPKNPNEIFSPDDGIVTPDIGPKKRTDGKILAVVIDDDYNTLDIMKIYLQRDYECATFFNPKDAIFYLNTHIPDVIFLDCYMTMISAQQILDILKLYKVMKDVPVYYLVEPEEEEAILAKRINEVKGILKRPVARGDLQKILDEIVRINDLKEADFSENSEDDDDLDFSFTEEATTKKTSAFDDEDDEDDDDFGSFDEDDEDDMGFGVFD